MHRKSKEWRKRGEFAVDPVTDLPRIASIPHIEVENGSEEHEQFKRMGFIQACDEPVIMRMWSRREGRPRMKAKTQLEKCQQARLRKYERDKDAPNYRHPQARKRARALRAG